MHEARNFVSVKGRASQQMSVCLIKLGPLGEVGSKSVQLSSHTFFRRDIIE